MNTNTTLATLIANHAAAAARLNRAIGMTDQALARLEGREVTDADRNEWAEASEAEVRASRALLTHRCADLDEAAERARYMAADPDLLDSLSEPKVAKAYLGSFYEPTLEIIP